MKFIAVASALAALVETTVAAKCYSLPGDSSWPSASAWNKLNSTVGGRLIATVPIGSPCHDPTYDAAKCAALQEAWTLPETHLPSSSSVMQAYFANRSCDPFTDRTQPCQLGNYVAYAVNASSVADVAATLKFAVANNVRFLVRNTGHDFFGRSTGAGALAAWTHNLKTAEAKDWSDSYYTGKAFKAGAGLIGYEAIEKSNALGLVVVGGECPTVGLAGGFIQGGGHSALSTQFGLAADQTLEFEVITAFGSVVTASRTQNSDLYWALSGGGGGTYGVVTSVTVKAYPSVNVAGANIQLAAAYTTQEKFFKAVSEFHRLMPAMIDNGGDVVYYVNSAVLVINPVTVYNQTSTYLKSTVLGPFLQVLADLAIPYSSSFTDLSYRDHYNTYMGPLPYGHLAVEEYNFGGRLIPRKVLETNNDGFMAVLKNLTDHGVLAIGDGLNVSTRAGVNNSVNPAWRTASIQLQITTPYNFTAPWSAIRAAQNQITNEFMPQLEAVTPGSGAYVNEGDFQQPNWKQVFFGSNYDKLLSIKNKWDPYGVFYALKMVGSDQWTVANNGRMCRA